MKVVKYWHGTIKNYRYDGDVSYIKLLEFIPLHHVILLNALLCSFELNTLDAWWIAADVWSKVVDAKSF